MVSQDLLENQAVQVNQDNVVDRDRLDNRETLVLAGQVVSTVQLEMLVNQVRQAKRALSKRLNDIFVKFSLRSYHRKLSIGKNE